MSRVTCQQCHRPEKSCICAFAVDIDNHLPVIILQHPSEVKQSKGTVTLLQQSLANVEVIVGEVFDKCELLKLRLSQYEGKVALLYPSEQAIELRFTLVNIANHPSDIPSDNPSDDTDNKLNEIKCIILLDGTWKKSYRMFMLNPCLHHITHIALPHGIKSLYEIRKTKKSNALSSLEACCHALARLENEPDKYQSLLNNFVKFNQFQQSFNQTDD